MATDFVDGKTPHTATIPPIPLSQAEREKAFGMFNWTPAPTPNNKEGIALMGDWQAKNILTVATPRLVHLGIAHVRFHRLAIKQLTSLIDSWANAGLLHAISTWDGSFVPRLKRGHAGSTKLDDLSNHSWGTAFDINARWNPLGVAPAPLGKPGCVRELVSIARQCGFFWGGDFKRPDGMHFEICKLIV